MFCLRAKLKTGCYSIHKIPMNRKLKNTMKLSMVYETQKTKVSQNESLTVITVL